MTTSVTELLHTAFAEHQAGRLATADAGYLQVLELDPNQIDALHLRGLVLHQLGQNATAIKSILAALHLKPDFAHAHYNLGNIYRDLRMPTEAVASYQHAIAIEPGNAATHYNLANSLRDLRQYASAAASYELALRLKPNYAKAMTNLGSCFLELEQYDHAEETLRRALQLDPSSAKAYSNLGVTLRELGRIDESESACRHSIALDATNAEAHNNLAATLLDQQQTAAAIASFDEAIRIRPEYAEARMNRGMAWLQWGEYERGWEDYRWRWQSKWFSPRQFSQPMWDGSDLHGRTILVYSEQGLGDTIQGLQYLKFLKARGCAVLFEAYKPLLGLLENVEGVDRVFEYGKEIPPFDLHVPIWDLPRLLRMLDPAQLPGTAYLRPRSDLAEHWRMRLEKIEGLRVGIHWQGNPKYRSDRQRSIPLQALQPLAQIPGVQLISLQKFDGVEQLQQWNDKPIINLGPELDEANGPFVDTAAVLTCLDLVITCNTSLCHLAGALGVPVWILLSTASDWRWGTKGQSSHWYKSARLFRQSTAGNWEPVVKEVTENLCKWARPRTFASSRFK